ncbi:MAG: hypothetical protein IT536_14630 [Hyphomicrobiales bacterium]|nr:hypothetical protein [Hyphomicrobiales bacterium]
MAQLFDRLRQGDAIIIPGGAAAARVDLRSSFGMAETGDADQAGSLELLRNLIAVRRGGGKK